MNILVAVEPAQGGQQHCQRSPTFAKNSSSQGKVNTIAISLIFVAKETAQGIKKGTRNVRNTNYCSCKKGSRLASGCNYILSNKGNGGA